MISEYYINNTDGVHVYNIAVSKNLGITEWGQL